MAEWLKRSTVNTFYRGSNPLKAFMFNSIYLALDYYLKLIIITPGDKSTL